MAGGDYVSGGFRSRSSRRNNVLKPSFVARAKVSLHGRDIGFAVFPNGGMIRSDNALNYCSLIGKSI